MDATPTVEITYLPPDPDGRTQLVAKFPEGVPYIDTVKVVSAKAREKYAQTLLDKAPALQRAQVLEELDRVAAAVSAQMGAHSDAGDPSEATTDPKALLAATAPEVLEAAEETLHDPMLIGRIVDDIASLGVAGERELGATLYLVGTSRLLGKTLAAITQGHTASGKSFQGDRVSTLFPPEAVIYATQMTPQALFHMPPGSLAHKFVVAGEKSRVQSPETAEATRALREMLSSGHLSKLMPVREGNKIVTRLIKQDGPIAFIESTTLTQIFDEDANRCLLLQTDEREEQTKRIYRAIAQAYSGGRGQQVVNAIIQRHHAMQRMLVQVEAVVPYAPRLAELIAANRVEGRRAFGHLMNAISACAILHQYQRDRTADGLVIASPLDYQIAKRLLDAPLSRLLGRRISNAAVRFHARLVTRFASTEFASTEAYAGESVCNRAVRDYLNELSDAGYVEQVQASKGSKAATWRTLPVDPDDQSEADLPPPDLVFPTSHFRLSGNVDSLGNTADLTEPAVIAGTPPTTATAEPEPSRQIGGVPAIGRESPTGLFVGTPEVPSGRVE